MLRKKIIRAVVLFFICVLIKIFSCFPAAVEKYYFGIIYPPLSKLFRILFGWIPFSIGDVLYIAVGVWILYLVVKFFRNVFKKKTSFRKKLLPFFLRCLQIVFLVYIVFNLFWGLNYNRKGIAWQLKLKPGAYSTQQLDTIVNILLQKSNATRMALGKEIKFPNTKTLIEKAKNAYSNTHQKISFINYSNQSIKASLFGTVGNYIGYSGYYNPFTGEAQLNTTNPKFILPYVVCHEMAHQMGYATEDEANFVGYLTARSSNDSLFLYSVYVEMFSYANRELFYRDSTMAKAKYRQLDTLVKQDLIFARKFYRKYDTVFGDVVTQLYSRYLKANSQPQGINTYTFVTAWLIAYYKKYGEI
jgi:hypothetical protein